MSAPISGEDMLHVLEDMGMSGDDIKMHVAKSRLRRAQADLQEIQSTARKAKREARKKT